MATESGWENREPAETQQQSTEMIGECPPGLGTPGLGAPGATESRGGRMSEKVSAETRELRRRAEETIDRAKAEARHLRAQARDKASEVATRAKEQGRSFAEERKGWLGDEISHISDAVWRAGDELRKENDEQLAQYTEALATRIDRVASYMRERNVDELIHDAAAATRRRPEIVFGGMFVAGLALARFLKASEKNGHRYDDEEYLYDNEYEYEADESGFAGSRYGYEHETDTSARYAGVGSAGSEMEQYASTDFPRESADEGCYEVGPGQVATTGAAPTVYPTGGTEGVR